MNPSFYDTFERNISGLSTDVNRFIGKQIDDLLGIFPNLKEGDINVELECRFKGVSPDKIVGPLLVDLDSKPGLTKTSSRIEDVNYNIDRYMGKSFTVRETNVNGKGDIYTKMKVFIPRESPAGQVIDLFDNMGLKLSFALEISSVPVSQALRDASKGNQTPLKRTKSRDSYFNSFVGASFDITQVVSSNTGKRETEIEIDSTVPADKFLTVDPIGKIKSFISFCEEQARLTIYRSRFLLHKSDLDRAISLINSGLKVDNPVSWRVDSRVPQVRNIQVQDLLKENYKGYAATPKADGYRYFMVILPTTIVLIQPPNSYKVLYEGRDIPSTWVGFVFDGELVERDNWKPENLNKNFIDGVDNYFCIFDVVNSPNTEFVDEGVLQRINHLKSYFEEVRRQKTFGPFQWSANFNSIYFQPKPVSRVTVPVKKTFFEIKPYDDATETTWYASDAFFETLLPKLQYENDGIIFTPVNHSYENLVTNMSLKWKPADLLSIDFRYDDGDLLISSRTSEGEPIEIPFRGTSLFPITRDEIDIENPNNVRLANGSIYEFIYEPSRKIFRVTRPRFDKSFPNALPTAVQVWTDTQRPVTSNLIRGIGVDGLIECQREALWSWFENLIGKSKGPICDLTGIKPSRDFPTRFLENKSFENLMKDTLMYRLGAQRYRVEFPKMRPLPGDLDDTPDFDILIINGQQLMLLEDRDEISVGDRTLFTPEYKALLRNLVRKSSRVFVRNMVSIVPGLTSATFHPERSACGNEEELVIKYLNEESVEIEFKPGSVFHDVATNTYNAVLKTRAYQRTFDESCTIVSAGHRITNQLRDNGPERILGGKHFGMIWDYVYNAMLPAGYFRLQQEQLFTRVTPEESPLDDLIELMGRTTITAAEPEPVASPVPEPFVFERAFDTVVSPVPIPSMELVREYIYAPGQGDLFEIISKAMSLIDVATPPVERVNYDREMVKSRGNKLRLLYRGLLRKGGKIEDLVEKIYESLNLGLVFVKRLDPASDSIQNFYSKFILPEKLHSPEFGFLIIEVGLDSKDLISDCSLLTYQSQILVHRSDPMLQALYNQGLQDEVFGCRRFMRDYNAGLEKLVNPFSGRLVERKGQTSRKIFKDCEKLVAESLK